MHLLFLNYNIANGADFAPKSSNPELWAGMGRVVRSITVSVIVFPTISVYNVAGSKTRIGLYQSYMKCLSGYK